MCGEEIIDCYVEGCKRKSEYEIFISNPNLVKKEIYTKGFSDYFTCLCLLHFIAELDRLLALEVRNFTIYPT